VNGDVADLNLALDPWIWVLRKDGSRSMISAWEITKDFKTNPVISIDATRAPWNAALLEFLIALYQLVLFPEDGREWRRHWETPPTPEELKRAFIQLADPFNLSGPHPFMQDTTLKADGRDDDYRKPIQKLLIDGVSENQEKHNSDLFEKSGFISALCAPCAVTALWDMQAHAPQGGPGYYVSLSGGGPARTLVLGDTLWGTVWSNVFEQAAFSMKGRPDPATFLPWMKPDSRKVDPAEECPLHVYWGMPRRILLEKSDAAPCSTCGSLDGVYHGFLSHGGGFQYSESQWRHPLSPYSRSKQKGEEWLVRNTEHDLAGYRNYMGILVGTPDGDGVPALVVRRAVERGFNLRILGYGYHCDQAAVISWCEGAMPTEMGVAVKEIAPLARTLVVLCQRGTEKLWEVLRDVLDKSKAGGVERARETSESLWALTESSFKRMLVRARDKKIHEQILNEWVIYIQRAALSLYRKALPRTRVDPMWAARFEHKLAGQISDRNPMTLKTKRYGDWRIDETV